MKLEIYTDGSFKQGWGSWSYIIVQDKVVIKEQFARTRKTNSNRMEFQAAIEAIKKTPEGSCVTVFTDCLILIENIPHFLKWSQNNWLKENLRPIANSDQFKILYDLIQKRSVSWIWVKAHAGNKWNERCDQLCTFARSTADQIL